MRWRPPQPSAMVGRRRIRRKFAWFATRMQYGAGDGLSAWMEFYLIEEELIEVGWGRTAWHFIRSDLPEFWDLPPGSCPL